MTDINYTIYVNKHIGKTLRRSAFFCLPLQQYFSPELWKMEFSFKAFTIIYVMFKINDELV